MEKTMFVVYDALNSEPISEHFFWRDAEQSRLKEIKTRGLLQNSIVILHEGILTHQFDIRYEAEQIVKSMLNGRCQPDEGDLKHLPEEHREAVKQEISGLLDVLMSRLSEIP